MRFVQQAQSVQQLLGKHPDQGGAESTELVLLDKLVKVDTEQLKCKTQVLSVNKSILQAKQVMVVVLVILAVQL